MKSSFYLIPRDISDNSRILRCLDLLNDADVVAFQHDSTEIFPLVCVLHTVLFSFIQYEIHVFVESNNSSFNS